jgi:hypothetical protein
MADISEYQIVQVSSRDGVTPREYLIHRDEADRFVAATVQLHGPGCVNPYSGNATTPVDLIAVGDVVPIGPFWWTTPDLLRNHDPAGARIFRAEVFKNVWVSSEHKARMEAHRQSELDAEEGV